MPISSRGQIFPIRLQPLWIFMLISIEICHEIEWTFITYVIICNSKKVVKFLLKIVLLGPYLEKNRTSMGHAQIKLYFFLEVAKWNNNILSIYQNLCLSYEWFSVLCDVLLPKGVIFSWNSCEVPTWLDFSNFSEFVVLLNSLKTA